MNNKQRNKQKILKIIVGGDSQIGKTSIISRYFNGTFGQNNATIGADFHNKQILQHNQEFTLQLWDVSGNGRYLQIASIYFQKISAIVLKYDITNRSSFESVKKWINITFQRRVTFNSVMMLIGNKCDLEDQREVQYNEGQDLANSNGFLFFEASAMSNYNINKSYLQLLDMVFLTN